MAAGADTGRLIAGLDGNNSDPRRRPRRAVGARSGATPASARSVGTWAFTGVAVSSLGGPLALAAPIVPVVTADAASSAGLTAIAAAVVFLAALAIWLRYVRHLPADQGGAGPSGGLYIALVNPAS